MYPRGRCYVHPDKKLVFIPTYKVASNAISQTLGMQGKSRNEFPWASADQFFKFAVVRNPVDRFVSAATMFISTPSIHMRGTPADPPTPEVQAIYSLSTRPEQMQAFLELSEQRYPDAFDTHFRSQISCLYAPDGRPFPLDRLLPIEHLRAFSTHTLGVEIPVKFSGESSVKEELKASLTPAIIDRIVELYQTDYYLHLELNRTKDVDLNEFVQQDIRRTQDASA